MDNTNNKEKLFKYMKKFYDLSNDILEVFLKRIKFDLEFDDIIEKIWGFDYEGDDRTVDVHIKRLRQRLSKLKSSVSIQTVRGQGYRVDQNV